MDPSEASRHIDMRDCEELAKLDVGPTNRNSCCGVKELSGLYQVGRGALSAADYLRGMIYRIWSRDITADHRFDPTASKLISCAHVMYNQAIRPVAVSTSGLSPNLVEEEQPKYGEMFTTFLVENKLGVVTRIAPTINPNSKNILTTYIWTIDHDAVLAWWKKNK